MGKVIERGKRRRAKQRYNEKAKPQYYGGSKEASKSLIRGKDKLRTESENLQDEGLQRLRDAQEQAQGDSNYLWSNYEQQRGDFADKVGGLKDRYAALEAERNAQAGTYGSGADAALGDYRAGRGAILGNASQLESGKLLDDYRAGRGAILGGADRMEASGETSATSLEGAGNKSAAELEGYARGAGAEYQSAADAAFNAATERNQKNALGLAAGRGANSIRTALATSAAGNQQAALDQQVTRAQEANQLNAMRNDAIAQAAGIRESAISGGAGIRGTAQANAAGVRTNLSAQDQAEAQQQADAYAQAAAIRSGVGSQDQAAAQIEAQRQQAAQAGGAQALGAQADLTQANAAYQSQVLGQTQQSSASNIAQAYQAGGAISDVGGQRTALYQGSMDQQQAAELGGQVQTELQRAEAAKSNDSLTKAGKWTNVTTLGILGNK